MLLDSEQHQLHFLRKGHGSMPYSYTMTMMYCGLYLYAIIATVHGADFSSPMHYIADTSKADIDQGKVAWQPADNNCLGF